MDCSVCGKKAEPAYSITHRCAHASHVDCIEGDIDPYKCPPCLTSPTGQVKRIESKVEEPHIRNKNYIKYPGTESKGLISSVGGAVVSLVSKVPQKKSAIDLVKEGVPILNIFREGYGLDHMLRDGVTIDHLMIARYKWDDLCLFEDVSKNGTKRALDAFAAGPGLRMTANHLRDYPDQLPFEEFKKVTALETSQLCTVLGLEFPSDDSLQCAGDKNWNAKDCVRLGLKMSDLISFGLYSVEQYKDLMFGLNKTEQKLMEKQLEVNEAQLEGLRNLEEEELIAAAEQQRSTTPQEEEEEEEQEEEEVDSLPPPAVRNQRPKKTSSPIFQPKFRRNPTPPPPKPKNKLAHLGYVK